MTIEELLILPKYELPRPRINEDKSIQKAINVDLESYLRKVQSKGVTFSTIDKLLKATRSNGISLYEKDYYVTTLEELVLRLKDTFEAYFSNSPSQAYDCLKQGLSLPAIQNILIGSKRYIVKRNQNFYRIRVLDKKSVNAGVGVQDLFHVPFHLRRFISTQRYSMPGFPCLYMGNSLAVAYHEVVSQSVSKGKIADTIPYAIRLTNTYPLRCFDLSPLDVQEVLLDVNRENEPHKKLSYLHKIYNYGLIWPIVASCYYQLNYAKKIGVSFKAEYILPQLMLQWFKDVNTEVDGIRYLSVNMCHQCNKKDTVGHNFVFPAKVIKEKGYCPILRNSFKVTQPVSAYKFKIVNYNDHNHIQNMEQVLLDQPTFLW